MRVSKIPLGTRVTKVGYGYTGRLIEYGRFRGQEFMRIAWDGRPFTSREFFMDSIKELKE